MDGKSVGKAVFVANSGLYEQTKLLFALRNVSATLYKAKDVVEATVRWQYASVYIDDIIVVCETPKKHLQHIEKIVNVVSSVRTITKMRKCYLTINLSTT